MTSGMAGRAYTSNQACPGCKKTIDIVQPRRAECSSCGAVFEATDSCKSASSGDFGHVVQHMVMTKPGELPKAVVFSWDVF